jgi:hypothetical protein
MLFEAYGGEDMKESSDFVEHKRFKEGVENVKMMKEVVVQYLTEPMKVLKKCSRWCIQIDV